MGWALVLVVLAAAGAYALRNRLLDWQRPALAARATAAAGRPVELSRVELDAGCRRLTLAGAVELAPGVRLAFDRAVITGVPALLSGRAAEAALAELEGSLAVDDPRGTLTAPLSVRGAERAPGQLFAGQVSMRDALAVHRASAQELLATATARLALDAAGWALADLHATGQGAAIEGTLSGGHALASLRGELRLSGASRELIAQVLRLVDPAAAPRVPGDLTLTAAAAIAPGPDVQVTGELATAASRLQFRFGCDAAGHLRDARCGGKLARADLTAAGALDDVPLAGDPEVALNASAEGSLFDPALKVEAFCATAQLKLAANPVLENATAQASRAPGGALALTEAAAQVTLAGTRGTASARATARPDSGGFALELADGRLTPRRAARRPPAGFAGTAHLAPGATWALSRIAVSWGEVRVSGELTHLAGQLELDGLDRDGLVDLSSQLGANLPALPPDLRTSARVTFAAGQPPALHTTLATATSQLWLTGALDAAAPAGWKLSGRLSTRDVNAMEWFAPVGLEPSAECFVDMQIEAGPRLAGLVRAPRLEVRTFRGRPAPKLELADVSARVSVSGDELTWDDVTGAFQAGRLTCAGRTDLTQAPFPYTCRIDAAAVDLGPLAKPHVEGRLSGHLTLEGRGADLAQLTGDGALTLDGARYPVLRRLEPTLGPYGLPVPPVKGTVPAHAMLALGRETLRLRSLDVRVEGVQVHGEVAIDFDETLSGRLEIDLEPAYLQKSSLLMLPAAVSKLVRIPATLGGTIFDPTFSADLQGAFGHWMKNYEFGSVTKGLLDTLDRFRPGQRLQPGPELDRVFERILSGAPNANDLMDSLAATGVSSHQLESWLADYRRRRERR